MKTFWKYGTIYRMKRMKDRIAALLILISLILAAWNDAVQIYEIEKGDTLSEIAFQFGLSMEQLQAANPEADLSLLKIGDQLVIPPNRAEEFDVFIQQMFSKYVQLNGTECFSQLNNQISCLLRIQNSGEQSLVNLQMQLEIIDNNGGKMLISSGTPLIQLLPGEEIPVLFSGSHSELSEPFETRFLIENLDLIGNQDTSFRLAEDLYEPSYDISADGLNADVRIRFTSNLKKQSIRILAAAYRADGTPNGIRSWIGNPASEIRIHVYSLSDKINSIKIWAEYY